MIQLRPPYKITVLQTRLSLKSLRASQRYTRLWLPMCRYPVPRLTISTLNKVVRTHANYWCLPMTRLLLPGMQLLLNYAALQFLLMNLGQLGWRLLKRERWTLTHRL